MYVCMQQVRWRSGVEMNEALISSALYLMWHTTIGWAILQSRPCIGTDRPWWEKGKKWRRREEEEVSKSRKKRKGLKRNWPFKNRICLIRFVIDGHQSAKWDVIYCSCFQTTERHLRALKGRAAQLGPPHRCPTRRLLPSVAVASEWSLH